MNIKHEMVKQKDGTFLLRQTTETVLNLDDLRRRKMELESSVYNYDQQIARLQREKAAQEDEKTRIEATITEMTQA